MPQRHIARLLEYSTDSVVITPYVRVQQPANECDGAACLQLAAAQAECRTLEDALEQRESISRQQLQQLQLALSQ